MITMLSIVLICISVLMVLVVLVQRGRGGGLSGAFGAGGGGNSAFGTKTGDVFTSITVVLFGVFLILAVILAKMHQAESLVPQVSSDLASATQATTKPALQSIATQPGTLEVTAPVTTLPTATIPATTQP
ncbi:MAG: preprotein translocase subunit SecG [Phycisphaerae bacterium]